MALELSGLDHSFGRQRVLENVSISVPRGACYGLLGHNGAGKSTALRIALGLLRPDRGIVRIDGRTVEEDPRRARRKTGGLIETTGFYGGASGRENLILLGRLAGMSRQDARRASDHALEIVGLSDTGKKAVKNFSLGMRQRLALAQALLGGPEYVLLDEPTNGLDPEGIVDVRRALRRLVDEEKITVLLSSHQLHEVADLCDVIGVMRSGKVVLEQDTRSLMAAGSLWKIESPAIDGVARVLDGFGATIKRRDPNAVVFDAGNVPSTTIAHAVVLAGHPLAALSPIAPTLEDIYLAATRGTLTATASTPAAPKVAANAELPPERPLPPDGPVRAIGRVLRHEFRRVLSGGAPYVLALPAVVAALGVLMRRHEAEKSAALVSGGDTFSTTTVNAFEGVAVGLRAGAPLLMLVIAGFASQSIAGELARGTLRNIFLRPLRRVEVAVGKALAVLLVTAIAYGVLLLAATGAAAWAFDFTGVFEMLPNGALFPIKDAADLRPELKAALIQPVYAMLAYGLIGFFAGSLWRSTAGAMAGAIGTVFLLDLLRAPARIFRAEAFLPSAYLPSPLGDTSILRRLAESATGISNAFQPFTETAVRTPVLWGAACFLLSTAIVTRRSCP